MDGHATEIADPPETAAPRARRRAAHWRPSSETRRLYAGDWAAFAVWCREQGRAACPAEPATVIAYIETLLPDYSYGALARRIAAIADQHRRRGLPPPATDGALRALLRAARRQGKRRPAPLSANRLADLAAVCTPDRTGQRDRAILLLLARGLGRGAIVGLDAEDMELTAHGMELALRPSPDEPIPAQRRAIDRDPRPELCPVRAMEDWMRATDTTFGPIFRKVDRWGNVEYNRLGTDSIRRITERWSAVARATAPRRTR